MNNKIFSRILYAMVAISSFIGMFTGGGTWAFCTFIWVIISAIQSYRLEEL